MKNIHDNLYEKLNPIERRYLTMSALARQDTEEVEKLRRTCPMKQYRMGDNVYFGTMNKLQNVVTFYIQLSQYFYNKIVVHEAYRFAAESNALMLKAGFNKAVNVTTKVVISDTTIIELDNHVNLLSEAKKLHEQSLNANVALLKATHEGLMSFCKNINLNAEHLIKWIALVEWCEDVEKYLTSPLKANVEYSRLVLKKITALWEQ